MCYLIAKIVNAMQFIYMAWNALMWNYHVNYARIHDARMCRLDPYWKEQS